MSSSQFSQSHRPDRYSVSNPIRLSGCLSYSYRTIRYVDGVKEPDALRIQLDNLFRALFIFILFRAKDAIGLTHEQIAQPSCRSKCRTFGTGSFPSSHSIMSFSVPHHRWSFIPAVRHFKYRFSFSPTSLYTLAGDIPSVSFTQRYFSISFSIPVIFSF